MYDSDDLMFNPDLLIYRPVARDEETCPLDLSFKNALIELSEEE